MPDGTLMDRVVMALRELSNLRVITLIGGGADAANVFLSAGGSGEARAEGEVPPLEAFIRSGGTMYATRINLVSGDNLCVLPNIDGDDPMRSFHEKQVQLGRDIMAANVTLLVNMIKDLKNAALLPPRETEVTAASAATPGGGGQ